MKDPFKSSWLFVIVFSIIASSAFSQVGLIKGAIMDEESPLQGATISVGNISTISDFRGQFSLTVDAGSYVLVTTHAGYKKFEQKVIIKAHENLILTITMSRADELGEVMVLGSRSVIHRSPLHSAIPIDRITTKMLTQTGQPSLIEMLNFTEPSFNTSRQHLTDPVTLRGLSPDHLLILLNGTRYHNLAAINSGGVRGTLGRASVSNDLNSIPYSAIEKIEVLRDGSSAQYGSDAVAGVMNIILKKTTGKTSITLLTGQHYKGDGENMVIGINRGIRLYRKSSPEKKLGFLNFSVDFRYRNLTHRGGEYKGTVYYLLPSNASPSARDSIIALDNIKILSNGFSRKTPVSNDGSAELKSVGFLINGGYSINNHTQLYWTGTFNYRHPMSPGAYRFPKNTNQVNVVLHPNGFKNTNIINTRDITAIAGAKGRTNTGWNWEGNSVFGQNCGRFYWKNTNNASQFALGANAPTELFGGTNVFAQQTNTINFAKDLSKAVGGVKTLNLGWGVEYRYEKFRTNVGEEAAWKNYDTSGSTQGGAQPSPGITPADVVSEYRHVAGLYLDLESDIDDLLLIDLAGRFENYNDFGNNLAGKLTIRYKLSRVFSLRASVSNGYHAPALQQIYYSATLSGFRNSPGLNPPVRIGIFRNNSSVTNAFGLRQLQPEKSINLGGGFTTTFSPQVYLTLDAYWIQIKDRIVLSGRFDRTNPDVDIILASFPEIDQVQFITNAIHTKTRGIDLVINGNWNIRKAIFGFTAAANFNRTNLFGPIQTTDKLRADSLNTNTLFNREERAKIENGQPGSKIILAATYKKGKVDFNLRSTRFGKTAAVYNSANKLQDEFFSAKVITDFTFNYSPKTWLTLTAGANNIFDVYPDRLKNYLNTTEGILIYSNEAIQFGYNGGSYFARMALNF